LRRSENGVQIRSLSGANRSAQPEARSRDAGMSTQRGDGRSTLSAALCSRLMPRRLSAGRRRWRDPPGPSGPCCTSSRWRRPSSAVAAVQGRRLRGLTLWGGRGTRSSDGETGSTRRRDWTGWTSVSDAASSRPIDATGTWSRAPGSRLQCGQTRRKGSLSASGPATRTGSRPGARPMAKQLEQPGSGGEDGDKCGHGLHVACRAPAASPLPVITDTSGRDLPDPTL
jgi:hypothetical protein